MSATEEDQCFNGKNSVGNQTLSSIESDNISLIDNGTRRFCLSPSTRLRLAVDVHRQSTSDDDSGCALEEYAWVPSALRPDLVHQYFATLPEEKVPYINSIGEKWRIRQLLLQLPPHDSEARYCRHLTSLEQKELKIFAQQRKRESLGRGVVKMIPYNLERAPCAHCSQPVFAGDLGVFASRTGDQVVYHAPCFVCHTCRELLVDLIYFCKDGRLYCGRHHGELYKPRCSSCDEIIFADECTEAEGRSWHLYHFVCYQCDASLGGERYVMRDGKQYCLNCFEILFADPCVTCQQLIAVDDPRMNHNERQWHATSRCFVCGVCKCPLLGKPFIPRDEGVFCSSECATKHESRLKLTIMDTKSKERFPECNRNVSPKFIHMNFNRFNLDELLRTSEDDDESDYESMSAKILQMPLENNISRIITETNAGKNGDKRRGVGLDMMARSVVTDKSSTDIESIYSHRSLPDLSASSNVSTSSKNSRKNRRRNPSLLGDDINHRRYFAGKSSVKSQSTEGSYQKACANSVITKLIAKKETTFCASENRPTKTCSRRTVRFGVEKLLPDRDDEDRAESILTEALRNDYCSTCSSSSSDEDDDFRYFTKPYHSNIRLAYVPPRDFASDYHSRNRFSSTGHLEKTTSKRGKSKTGNNCIVS